MRRAALLGVAEGLADLSASSLNFVAGWLSDRTSKRKIFALAGYGFSMFAKTILLTSSSIMGLNNFFASSSAWARVSEGRRAMPGLQRWLTKMLEATRLACIRH